MASKKKAKKISPLWKDRKKSPYRTDSKVDHLHLVMDFYQADIPQKKTLDEASEALMADIRKAAKKHGFIYSGTTGLVRHAQ